MPGRQGGGRCERVCQPETRPAGETDQTAHADRPRFGCSASDWGRIWAPSVPPSSGDHTWAASLLGATAAARRGLIGLRRLAAGYGGRFPFGFGGFGAGRDLALLHLGDGTAPASRAAFIGHDGLAHGHRPLGVL